MKRLCCSKYIFLVIFLSSALLASLSDKSAVIYYGSEISYPMVGIHDYIIVKPENTNIYTHGFDVYKDKMYASISIGEVNSKNDTIKENWILAKNSSTNSDIVDVTNLEYQKFFIHEIIEPQIKRGFNNFFLRNIDSYKLLKYTASQVKNYEEALIKLIYSFHMLHPKAKIIIDGGVGILDRIYDGIEAVVLESSSVDSDIKKIKSYNLEVICTDYLDFEEMNKADKIVEHLKSKGAIPYVSPRGFTGYGRSSKNATKREILVLITENEDDRIDISAHTPGALASN